LENVTRFTQALRDPSRCVHVGDREADIFELFHAARDAGILALERGKPAVREPIRWKLLTDLPVDDFAAAVEKLS
jgi:hypothetical protein